MEILLIISWVLGIILSILIAVLAFITKDKQLWETSLLVFICMLLTGYITALPLIAAVILLSLNKRFE